ncbi:MAG: aminoglycoside phosphotransferase family protein, partial [Chlamydiae bacterium]|nr:aminoglycoside phosphotransferase family protein [Chlamydiota bacterium]
MDHLIDLYRCKLSLPDATFMYIDHEDAMVATVFKVTQIGKPDLILKVCSRKGDFLREAYFLDRFAGKIPVPKIVALVEPIQDETGAILMEHLGGELLKEETMTNALA